MAMVLLGMAAAGVLLPFSHGAAVQAEGRRITLGAKLASDLLERIVATPSSQIVSTWDGYAEAQGQVTDAGGTVFTDPMYANFSRSVACHERSGGAARAWRRISFSCLYRSAIRGGPWRH